MSAQDFRRALDTSPSFSRVMNSYLYIMYRKHLGVSNGVPR
jgi:hypothetical protein